MAWVAGVREADRVLDAVGLGDRKDFRPRDLSGGQRQRVAVARALAGPASVILADEPTGNLDSESGNRVLTMFRDLSRSQGRALLIVTHDPLVRLIADRVVTIRDGRLDRPGRLEPMSLTMILGRVVLPAIGLILAATLTWQSVRNITNPPDLAPVGQVGCRSITRPDQSRGKGCRVSRRRVTVGTEVLGTIIGLPAREGGRPQRGPAGGASGR